MSIEITQTDFDSIVLGIVEHQVRLGIITAAMRRQGDTDAWRREEELMMLQNIVDALRDYDVTDDYLSNQDILDLHELVILIVADCSI